MPYTTATDLVTVDSNILIYALDERAGAKQLIARQILVRLAAGKNPTLPLQALSEFYRATTRKGILHPSAARKVVEQYQRVWNVVPPDSEDLTAAMAAHQDHNLPFFDALLWATARRAGCTTFITEDFQDGRVLGGVTFRNPFAPGFDIEETLRA